MAESADILALPHQQVILPDLAAGCSMADMVAPDQLETCWANWSRWAWPGSTVPVTYINSAAAIKAFVGERGGTTCTSSNAKRDAAVGVAREKDSVSARPASGPQYRLEDGSAARGDGGVGSVRAVRRPDDRRAGAKARLILWKGHCSVHVRFTVKQIEAVAQQYPASASSCIPRCRSMCCRPPTTAARPNTS